MADDGAGPQIPQARSRLPRRRTILKALTGVVVIGMAAAGIRVFLEFTRPRTTISMEGHLLKALATAQLDGRPVLVSGGGTIQVWDLDTGAQIGRSITFGDGWVSSIATAEVDNRPVIISSDAWMAYSQWDPHESRPWLPPSEGLRIWDLATGARIGRPLLDTGWVDFLSTAQLDGRTVVVAVSSYGQTVAAWDLTTGAIVGDRLTGDFAVTALATASSTAPRSSSLVARPDPPPPTRCRSSTWPRAPRSGNHSSATPAMCGR